MDDVNESLDLAWGAAEIGNEIGRTARQTFHLLQANAIRSARKVKGRWAADRKELRAEFRGAAGATEAA